MPHKLITIKAFCEERKQLQRYNLEDFVAKVTRVGSETANRSHLRANTFRNGSVAGMNVSGGEFGYKFNYNTLETAYC